MPLRAGSLVEDRLFRDPLRGPFENQRYFYQLDGEGIRYELAAFARAADTGRAQQYMTEEEIAAISGLLRDFEKKKDFAEI